MSSPAIQKLGRLLGAGLLVAALVLGRAPAFAVELAALVTEASGAHPELVRDSLLSPGQAFDLGPEGRVVLAYFQSCVTETIRGGRFTVGADRSQVIGGEVVREFYECLGNTAIAAGADAESGGVYSRSISAPETIRTTQPILLVSGIDAGQKVHFTIERLDQASPSLALERDGPVLDLMHIEKALAPGGKYKVSAEGRTAIFIIVDDPPAVPVSTFARLIVLQ
jgi:hypothetical protein